MSDGPEVVDAEIIDDNMRAEEAESLCRWAAARAGAIVVVPGLGPLSLWANDIYLIMKMGKLFGETLTQKAAADRPLHPRGLRQARRPLPFQKSF